MTAAAAPPGRDTWKRLSPDERRAQLIAIAEELFQTRPYPEIGVVDVAKAAGITHGLIYHYFPSKEALFTAAFEARAAELLERCFADPALPVTEQVELGVRGYLDYVETHRVAYLNLFRGVVAGHEDFVRICDDTRRAIMTRFLAGLGLEQLALPATRLSLRGYIGYIESAVLDWLEAPHIPRAMLEQLIFAVIGTSLRTGLLLDQAELGDVPISAVFDVYDEHFRQQRRRIAESMPPPRAPSAPADTEKQP
jgi:AcrR family transcriptional regulator